MDGDTLDYTNWGFGSLCRREKEREKERERERERELVAVSIMALAFSTVGGSAEEAGICVLVPVKYFIMWICLPILIRR